MGNSLAEEIHQLRIDLGWSAAQMAGFFDKTRATIYNWEKGASRPKKPVVAVIRAMRAEYRRRVRLTSQSELDRWLRRVRENGIDCFMESLLRPVNASQAVVRLLEEAAENGGTLVTCEGEIPGFYVIPLHRIETRTGPGEVYNRHRSEPGIGAEEKRHARPDSNQHPADQKDGV